MKTRTSKALGATAGIAAIALSLPLATSAHADPAAEPAPEPIPEAELPDPQGPECDAFKEAVPNYKELAKEPVGTAIASIPSLSTFSSAISGQVNPAVNIVPVLENGPYVVFAPTNEAFTEMGAQKLEALKGDPAALSDVVYYHAFLGLLGQETVEGQRPTQQGAPIKVTGSGGDIKVNETAEVVCGDIQVSNARIYMIDKVLDPAQAPDPLTASTTETTATTTETTEPTEPTETAEETPDEADAA